MMVELLRSTGTEQHSVCITDVVIAGWTGRDPQKVQEHIEELAALGIRPPASTPCFYRVGGETLTSAPTIDCLGANSSGEAEYVILVDGDGAWWVGVGSDHTDRRVEAYSIPVSKQMCPKPIAPAFWRFEDVADHWDRLELRSWVGEADGLAVYQAGTVAAISNPHDTVARYLEAGRELRPGSLLFGGTLPVLGGIRPREVFRFELRDPVHGRSISHHYTARWLAA